MFQPAKITTLLALGLTAQLALGRRQKRRRDAETRHFKRLHDLP